MSADGLAKLSKLAEALDSSVFNRENIATASLPETSILTLSGKVFDMFTDLIQKYFRMVHFY